MISTLGELELHCIDQMPRQQIVEEILAHRQHLPVDLVEGLARQVDDHLRLLLLASRIIRVFRIWGVPREIVNQTTNRVGGVGFNISMPENEVHTS